MPEKDGMVGPDLKWLNSLKRYIGDGSQTGTIPYFRLTDGTVDVDKTLDTILAMFGIKPVSERTNAVVD